MQIVLRDPDVAFLDTNLWVPKRHINADGLKRALTFDLSSSKEVNILTLWKETEHHIGVPREFYPPDRLPCRTIDCRPRSYPQTNVVSRIKLDHRPVAGVLRPTGETVQQQAVEALLNARGGILQLKCGGGKTVIFLELAARMGVPTLIALDTTLLIEQWSAEIETHLEIPGGVGLIQAGIFDWQKAIVLTTYHTLAARAESMPAEVCRWFGLIGWDEGHHSSAQVWSRSLDIFFGKRIILSATPNRDDGMDLVYKFAAGPVIFKDLKPEMIPRIYFLWTGLTPNIEDQATFKQIHTKTGDVHLKKLSSFFSRWPIRRELIVGQIRLMRENGRQCIVVGESIDECVNLFALWNGRSNLYTDIPIPTTKEVADQDSKERIDAKKKLEETRVELRKTDQEKTPKKYARLEKIVATQEQRLAEPELLPEMPAHRLDNKALAGIRRSLTSIFTQLKDRTTPAPKQQALIDKYKDLMARLAAHRMSLAIQAEHEKRQRAYIQECIDEPSDAGLLIEYVPPKRRLQFVKERPVLFSITKYGREALDKPELDTVLVSVPFSSRNILQQLLGRPSRRRERKKTPVVVILEDNFGTLIGMCQKLRKHMRSWAQDEGGPLNYEMMGHPKKGR